MIELKNIKFHYHAQAPLFQALSWTFPACDSLSVMGRSGEGKTTLLHLMGTLISPLEGEVFIQGEKVDFHDQERVSHMRNQKIAFIFQDHALLPQLTSLENALLPLRPRGKLQEDDVEKARELMERVGLAGKEERYPSELSGGESQRVAVVRALITTPRLILMDEPTGSLDKANADRLLALFSEIQGSFDAKIVLVTHDASVAKKMDQQLVLEKGELIPA